MAIAIGDQLQIGGKRVANLDANYGPYNSTSEAMSVLGPSGRNVIAVGLTVGIKNADYKEVIEYWFKKDENDNFVLVKKETSKPIIDLSEFNASTQRYLPELASESDFVYRGEAIYTVPYMVNETNYVLAYVCAVFGSNYELVEKVYLIEKNIIREMYEADAIPEELRYYLPEDIAKKIKTIEKSIYWNY